MIDTVLPHAGAIWHRNPSALFTNWLHRARELELSMLAKATSPRHPASPDK
jgi:hypothetical protein